MIRVRASMVLVDSGRILLVPHYDTDKGPLQWNLPGGKVEFGENLQQAAIREVLEETGLNAEIDGIFDVSEVILFDQPWHSVTITFLGHVESGNIKLEKDHPFGRKCPRWFSFYELEGLNYHPKSSIEKAIQTYSKDGNLGKDEYQDG